MRTAFLSFAAFGMTLGVADARAAGNTRVVAPGVVLSFTLGRESAFGVGLDAQFLAFDRQVGSSLDGTVGVGGYLQSQLLIPSSSKTHFRHSLGFVGQGGGEGGTWLGSRVGGYYRSSAAAPSGVITGGVGPELQPFLGAGSVLSAWIGLRVGLPVTGSHGPEVSVLVGTWLGLTVAGWPMGAVDGRPLVVDGVRVVAHAVEGHDWAESLPEALPDELRAARWTRAALDEHASIAAFARLSLQLLSIGAPPRLVRAAHRAALDEVRHAELCFGLARRFGATSTSPGAMPRLQASAVDADLVTIALESLLEGALNEGVAAAAARARLRRTEDPEERAALAVIARDEARHARLGEEIVHHCLAAEPGRVGAAVARTLASLVERTSPSGRRVARALVRRLLPKVPVEAAAQTV